ncbi:hypothetical protein QA612_11055 [Evansella sp. AB-P1]|uniref:cytochrome bd oxidase small subunit CydS n=1 Tax=Evansella sp. AB-P1 TaxID=3037653 RepID=UPI00241E4C70|nr:hypothetical protein [Evansella sp. AB-P1]MDG5788028.1 hypothetical protein [Evansella sp. AB-P1]
MSLTWFLIMIAPPLTMVACIIIVFIWATKGKPPAFVTEAEQEETNDVLDQAGNNLN